MSWKVWGARKVKNYQEERWFKKLKHRQTEQFILKTTWLTLLSMNRVLGIRLCSCTECDLTHCLRITALFLTSFRMFTLHEESQDNFLTKISQFLTPSSWPWICTRRASNTCFLSMCGWSRENLVILNKCLYLCRLTCIYPPPNIQWNKVNKHFKM